LSAVALATSSANVPLQSGHSMTVPRAEDRIRPTLFAGSSYRQDRARPFVGKNAVHAKRIPSDMGRVIFTNLLLFCLPFAAWMVWLRLFGPKDDKPAYQSRAVWLVAAGLVLVLINFFVLGQLTGAAPDSVYVPPSVVDGKVVPGHFEPATPAPVPANPPAEPKPGQ
jgi:hypothetical protein